MTTYEALGLIGSLLICISGIPQIAKTFRTKSTGDLSMIYLTILLAGMVLMQVYSLHTRDMVFIACNTMSLIITATLLTMCLLYRSNSVPANIIAIQE
ncbi:MAG: hypothetical protein KKB30_16565 [Proteobacteria bacterium]|nr:hypothetical protein [Pseudomonadota bacterium]MBU1716657.1 hypothetical protein [Pseudomonadota bacterium]